VTGHTIVVGFGTKGKAAVEALTDQGTPAQDIVVVDAAPSSVRGANLAGLTGVTGDATRRQVLTDAEAGKASRIVVAVPRDDTAVLITLTARQLNPAAMIVATIREAENESLVRRSGADHVIVSAEAAGRLLGLTAAGSAVGDVLASVLSCEGGIELTDRAVDQAEVGRSARSAEGDVVAVVRGGTPMAPADPALGPLTAGDRLVLTEPPASGA
jgi:voltage-gated potassium channel